MTPTVIGIDVHPTTRDQVVVYTQPGHRLLSQTVDTSERGLQQLLDHLQAHLSPTHPMVVVMEATGMAWFPVATFFHQHDIPVYRVKGQQSRDLRRVISRYVKTDRIDAEALCTLYYTLPHRLYPLHLPAATQFTLKRWIQRYEDDQTARTREINRLQELIRWALPEVATAARRYSQPTHRRIIAYVMDYPTVRRLGRNRFAQWAQRRNPQLPRTACDQLYDAALQSQALYGPHPPLDPAATRQEALDLITHLETLETHMAQVEQRIQQINDHLWADVPLQSVYGINQKTEAVIKAYLGDGSQFSTLEQVESWVGFLPRVSASGQQQHGKGAPIRKDGPTVRKAFFYMATETARQWDPHMAAHYYKGMTEKGYQHTQAIGRCVNKFLARVMRVLRTKEPYELRDCHDQPVTWQEARKIIQEQYTVPPAVRRARRRRTT